MSGFLEQRLGHCLRQMAEKALEALLVTHLTNSYYLTGFSGTAATVLITAKRRVLITDSRYTLLAKASAGMTYSDFDGIPRQLITEAGYGSHFTHGIGHGIGLDIHENPFFGKSEQLLQAGMVVTDEPGIYLDNKYGVRIEDDLVITETGCQVLTLAPKELIVL
ncbi:TPA: aminopeptidase P family protein [Streptococcus pyogenes]|nr:aminopeptidase P family protein [Streptococcus pyogenes]